jgi:hypothetical protein
VRSNCLPVRPVPPTSSPLFLVHPSFISSPGSRQRARHPSPLDLQFPTIMPPLPPRSASTCDSRGGALARLRALVGVGRVDSALSSSALSSPPPTPPPVLVVVYYRGVWDPFCVAWGRSLAHMRSLPTRLEALHAHLVFVSSQPRPSESAAADELHFGRLHPARRAGRVHFVNDEDLELVDLANQVWGASVKVLPSNPDFAAGYHYRNGIIQPAVVAIAAPWTSHAKVVWNQSFTQGYGGPNGDVLDRPPACVILRGIENALVRATDVAP